MWCRLFRSVPSWKREASRAEAWLQAKEAEEEVLRPSDFPGCDSRNPCHQAADLDDHSQDCLARDECYFCGCPAVRHNEIMGEHWGCSDCDCRNLRFAQSASGSVVGDTADTSPTVGETFGSPPWGDANDLLDQLEALLAEHQPFVSVDGLVRCQACGWWGLWPYDKTVNQVIAPHHAQIAIDRIKPKAVPEM